MQPTSQSPDRVDNPRGLTFALTLSAYELTCLMDWLGYNGLPGFTVPEDYDDRAAAIVEQSLRARGFLTEPDETDAEAGDLVVDDFIGGLISSGLVADHILNITSRHTDQAHWVFIRSDAAVYYTPQPDGIQRFLASNSGESMGLMLMTILGLHEVEAAVQSPVVLDKSTYDRTRDLAQNGHLDAAYKQVRGLLPEDMATAFIEPEQTFLLSEMEIVDRQLQVQNAAAILFSEDSYWLVSVAGTNQMQIRPAGRGDVLAFIANFGMD